jgi:hypothetical protein
MRKVLACFGLVAVAVAYGGCIVDPDIDLDRPCVNETCELGPGCRGAVAGECSEDADGCRGWEARLDCSALGARCDAGYCAWSETCPDGVDAFCRNGYILFCEAGKIARGGPCAAATKCQEVVTAEGRRAAICAVPGETCANDDPHSMECLSANQYVVCEYGFVTLHSSCAGGTCTPVETPSGKHVLGCARPGGAGCSNTEASSVSECRGNTVAFCEHGVYAGFIDCASDRPCRKDGDEHASCQPN